MIDHHMHYHMHRALLDFISAGNRLSALWHEDAVTTYPEYLPSFDEFLVEFSALMDESGSGLYEMGCAIEQARGE